MCGGWLECMWGGGGGGWGGGGGGVGGGGGGGGGGEGRGGGGNVGVSCRDSRMVCDVAGSRSGRYFNI